MQIDLSPEQISFVDLGIQEGRFRDQEEAVRQALALWEKRERTRIQLLTDIDAGEASFDGTETTLESAEDIQKFVEDIATRGRGRLAKA
jgi:putative addiction module CopG family antidote